MKVFLDDVRLPPEGWVLVRTVEEAIAALKAFKVTHISLDNDLGEGFKEGHEVSKWIEFITFTNKNYMPPVVTVHSSNTPRRKDIEAAIRNIERFVKERSED